LADISEVSSMSSLRERQVSSERVKEEGKKMVVCDKSVELVVERGGCVEGEVDVIGVLNAKSIHHTSTLKQFDHTIGQRCVSRLQVSDRIDNWLAGADVLRVHVPVTSIEYGIDDICSNGRKSASFLLSVRTTANGGKSLSVVKHHQYSPATS
jgi:hypothetical protein